ncbi:MAG: hypothetical protein NT052_00615 [Candidatus Shapirobacteria bacterium]|nr:hypothetical protein [Candidatus Shapirobacteria bacterium]
MKQEIDFLKGQRSEKEKRIKFLRSLKVGSIIFLIAFILVVGAIFSYRLYLNSQNEKIINESNLKRQKIESLKGLESLQVVLEQRLKALNQFFKEDKRPNFPKILAFFDKISQVVNIKDLNITSDGKMNISGESSDILTLTGFLENLESKEAQEIFSQITVSSLDKKEKEGYLFVILFQIKD